jgi:hypothetical protein
MHERHLEPEHPAARAGVDQLDAFGGELIERGGHVADLVGDVVHPLAALGEEAADGRVLLEGRQELDPAVAETHRRRLDPLVVDPLPMLEPAAEQPLVRPDGRVEILDRDADVMDGLRLHHGDATAVYAMLAAVRRLALLGLVALLGLAACGGGKKTNGEESKSAAQVVADAQAAAKSASIVHVVGGGVDNGRPIKLNLWIGDGKGKGHLEEGGLSFDLVRIGKTVYVKAGAAFWKRFGGAAAAALLHDKWVKAPTAQAQVQQITGLVDKTLFFSSILGQHGKIENRGIVDYRGQKVVEIRDTTQGGSLYVASEGTAYPVAVNGGKNQGDVDFTDWNATDEPIVAPKNAVDLSALGG